MENLTSPQKNFFFNQNLEREVNDGGFSQFFFNSSGKYAHETILSLQAIDANNTADILKEAIAQFPDSKIPKEVVERYDIYMQILKKANETWEQLDQRFYAYEDNLNELNINYVKQNQNSF